jgi:Flp pilus assembly secretin CpaC
MTRPLTGAGVVLAALSLLGGAYAACSAGPPARRYVTVDRSIVVDAPQRFTKVSVANAAIADVVVITPHQFLINGKAAGVTTLVVFYPERIESWELVVHSAPPAGVTTPLVPSEARHIVIQRADKITIYLFVPNEERGWVELEGSKAEPEPTKK